VSERASLRHDGPTDETKRDLARNEWVEERVNSLRDVLTDSEPDLTLALGNYRRALAGLALLSEITREWLDDTDEADNDDPSILDFYTRVGARWGKGNYYRRFRETLNGIN
jgi:hypothetical protein